MDANVFDGCSERVAHCVCGWVCLLHSAALVGGLVTEIIRVDGMIVTWKGS